MWERRGIGERKLEERDAVVRDIEVAAFVALLAPAISVSFIGGELVSLPERGWDGR